MEGRLSASLARSALLEAWPRVANLPAPAAPVLVVMGGVPLSGKSTLARAAVAAAKTRTLRVENDAMRERVARALHRPAPEFDPKENFLTYHAAWALLTEGLARGANVVHDATNLDERARRGAYDVADAAGAPGVVVLVLTAPAERERRARTLAPTRQQAAAKLGGRNPNPESVRRPLLVLDGAAPVEDNLDALRQFPPLAPLFGA